MTGTRNGASKRDRTTYARGERTRHAKLDAGQVIEIRELVERRERLRAEVKALSNAAIAERYGVSRQAVENIISRNTWGHV
jgi:hypothetical protein